MKKNDIDLKKEKKKASKTQSEYKIEAEVLYFKQEVFGLAQYFKFLKSIKHEYTVIVAR